MTYSLPPRQNRIYLPEDFDASNATHVGHLLFRLKSDIPKDFRTAHEWFALFQEASSAISETHTILELDVLLVSNDRNREERLQKFDSTILNQMLECRSELMDIYLKSPWKGAMHADDNGLIERDFQMRRKYANPVTIPLQLQENQLVRDYRSFFNNLNTNFQGRDTSVSVFNRKKNDQKEEVRREAFLSYWGCVETNEEQLQDIFQKLFENRIAQAKALGLNSYVPFAFSELGRLDYTPADCKKFRDSILLTVSPVLEDITKAQLASLGTNALQPWNALTWPALFPHTAPCHGNLAEILQNLAHIATQTHPAFGALFKTMSEHNLIDIHPRPRKSPGAFCVTFQESRMPFVFGNFAPTYKDSMTLLHEFGHAIHSYATSTISNVLLRLPGLEFCEVASMGFEMLASRHLHHWWGNSLEAEKAVKGQLFNALQFWPFMAMIDEFQHELYNGSTSSAQERNKLWAELSKKYKPQINWEPCPGFEKLGWFSRPHVFTSPFYYIDYGIAQLGAMQLWRNSQQNYEKTVESYISALSLGAQRPLGELFRTAGINLDFSPDLVGSLAKEIKQFLCPK